MSERTELQPIYVEWCWRIRPFRAYFQHGGSEVGVSRWTPWAARDRAERLQDGMVDRVVRAECEDRRWRRERERRRSDAERVLGPAVAARIYPD